MILGLDIGGANLKGAAADGPAVSVPFALWKQPDALPAALAALAARFPDASAFAVTMTGELCDCYPTKRDGVNAILNAVEATAKGRPVRVWATDGAFRNVPAARAEPLAVAAANWHALATFAGRFAPRHGALLLDIGSTTSDLIPLSDGRPVPRGLTDPDRMRSGELVYTGFHRTPVCAVLGRGVAAEFFATVLDAYLLLGWVGDDPAATDTADGRPATREFAHARLSRMLGGDPETVPRSETLRLAERVLASQTEMLTDEAIRVADAVAPVRTVITAGSGEALARPVLASPIFDGVRRVSLAEELGPGVSTCAPAFALAVLAGER